MNATLIAGVLQLGAADLREEDAGRDQGRGGWHAELKTSTTSIRPKEIAISAT